jgi:[amino group carrier protein]-6-phospho-L-2-aminoadipate/5-phospho-L-glutamate reductase
MKVSVIGAGGYIGGELTRLLLSHPEVELVAATSGRHAGQPLHAAHPNLRKQSDLTFITDDEVEPCDVAFLAMPHGAATDAIDRWSGLAQRIIDLSADFRLRDTEAYQRYYQTDGPDEQWRTRFQAGIPELNRENLRTASHIAVPGCMANASILALYPLTHAGLVTEPVIVDARTGSSGGGTTPSPASHHPERSGALRIAKPHGHRHVAEIVQACGVEVHMTVTAVEAVRGVQVVCHITLNEQVSDRDLWRVYASAYGGEPFVRLIRERSALRRLPEPKILSGTNFCDIGLALDPDGRHLIAVSALDNLVKGGAGNAVQCFNIATGQDERTGLRFAGLHPA